MIDEARASAGVIAERKQQEAIVAAEQILAKAREASALEHERTMSQLKRELGRLVVDTTAKVTGKVLTPEDQKRLQEEASRQVALNLEPHEDQQGRSSVSPARMVRASFVDGELDRRPRIGFDASVIIKQTAAIHAAAGELSAAPPPRNRQAARPNRVGHPARRRGGQADRGRSAKNATATDSPPNFRSIRRSSVACASASAATSGTAACATGSNACSSNPLT